MFTGLIENIGEVISVSRIGEGAKLIIRPKINMELEIGDSVAVNGVCLTVSERRTCLPDRQAQNAELSFDISPETMRSTNLGELKLNDKVNLERALRLNDRLGGHIVTGHVDGVGVIKNKRQEGDYTIYTFEAPPEILKYTVKKGSVAVDGISLTVNSIDSKSFSVAIIPHTLKATNIGDKDIGDKVNLEVDIIGKYIEKFMSSRDTDADLLSLIREKGFTE